VPAAIIDQLRAEFDATTILTGGDIGARYHTDMAGRRGRSAGRGGAGPRTTEDVSRLLKLCHAGARACHHAGRHDRPGTRHDAGAE